MKTYLLKLGKNIVPTRETKIVLANTLNVPPIAIGAWQWGDTRVWDWKPEAEKDAKEAYDKAVELGIPFVDTAEIYGNGESEREIRRFREHYTPEQREEQIIATKYFPHDYRTQFPDVLLSALKDSLDRLGMQKSDLYQIHAAIHPVSIEVVANALADAHDAGLVRAVGVSNYGLDETRQMYEALKKRGVPLASNQLSYSLIRRIPETSGLLKLCHDLGIAVLAYSPIGMGLLTGKYGPNGPFPEARRNNWEKLDKTRLTHLLDTIGKLSKKYDRPESAIALNWVICKGAIPLAGARNAHQVEGNAKALDFRLTDDEIADLDAWSFEGELDKGWKHG